MENKDILEFIYKKRDSKPKLGLTRIKKLLNYFGNPQDNLKIIHIAGTNGKGSTTTMIANVLKCAGYKVGKYISPFIVDFTERIQINNEYIKKEEVVSIINEMKDIINQMEKENNAPSSFEIITAIAFLYYARNNCDFVCLEVGMGGRFDATNVIENPLCSVITVIDYDHMEYLGNTLEEIAFEKSGIIKEKCSVVCYPLQKENAKIMIKTMAQIRNSDFIVPDIFKLNITQENTDIDRYDFKYNDNKYSLSMSGKYQVYNAITAIECVNVIRNKGIKISDIDVINGINTAQIPARLEIIKKYPLVVVDGSHNESGARTIESFVKSSNLENTVGIIGMIDGKRHDEVLRIIAPLFKKIIVVPISKITYETQKDQGKNVFKIAKKYNNNCCYFEDYQEAYKEAIKYDGVDGIVITGSLYLASEFRKMLLDDTNIQFYK